MRKFKSIFVLLLTAILVWSCSDKNEIIQEPDQPVMEKVKIQISATLGTDTRTSLAADGSKVLWGVGDEISVFHNGKHSKFVSQNTEPSETAVFEGYVEVPAGESVGTLYGVYPYSSSNQQPAKDDRFIVTLPDVQTAVEGTFADDLSISVGKSTGLSMTFYNVCGLVEFTVDRDDVVKVTLKDKDESSYDLSLAGMFLINFYNSTDIPQATLLDANLNKTEISIATSDGAPLKEGAKYYMAVVPNTYSADMLSFEFVTDEGEILEKTIAESVYIGRSKIKSFLNVNEGAVSTQYVTFEDEVFEKYCIDNFDTNKDGKISKVEAEAVTNTINVGTSTADGAVTSLKGIEYFVNVSQLYVTGHYSSSEDDQTVIHKNLQMPDLSKNTKLNVLNMSGIASEGELNLPDVEKSLRVVEVSYSNVTKLALNTGNYNLSILVAGNNPNLTTLEVNAQNLIQISTIGSPVRGVDLSSNHQLQQLYADDLEDWQFASSNYQNLRYVKITGSKDNDYSLSGVFQFVQFFEIGDFKSLDLSAVINLQELTFGSSVCESVDLSKCNRLERIIYKGTKLKSLDISCCTSLNTFYSIGSGLPKLVVGVGQQISSMSVDSGTQIVQKGSSSTESFTRN